MQHLVQHRQSMVRNVSDWIHTQLVFWVSSLKAVSPHLIGADGEKRTIRKLRVILEKMGPTRHTTKVTDHAGHDLRYAIDSTKCQRWVGNKIHKLRSRFGEDTIKWYTDLETGGEKRKSCRSQLHENTRSF